MTRAFDRLFQHPKHSKTRIRELLAPYTWADLPVGAVTVSPVTARTDAFELAFAFMRSFLPVTASTKLRLVRNTSSSLSGTQLYHDYNAEMTLEMETHRF